VERRAASLPAADCRGGLDRFEVLRLQARFGAPGPQVGQVDRPPGQV
jgi:hypothetical protein